MWAVTAWRGTPPALHGSCALSVIHPVAGLLVCSALRHGAIAQLGERLNGIQKVRGSNPLSSTIYVEAQTKVQIRTAALALTTG